MNNYDHIIVGGGISGMTLTLLLARQGRKVLLVEKGPRIGGATARFRRQGVPFDVGFHFTGGLLENKQGMFDDMLKALGVEAFIKPQFVGDDVCHKIAFPAFGTIRDVPSGIEHYRDKLKQDFPKYRNQFDQYFARLLNVCDQTASMNIRRLAEGQPPSLDDDFKTLQQVLDELFGDDGCEDKDAAMIKAELSVFCMCHGSRPNEISFANHARIAFAMYESSARVEDGGDAFVKAFKRAFETLDIEVNCSTEIRQLADIKERRVGRFMLSDGREVSAESCIFTIHPQSILPLLPAEHVSRAFLSRVQDFEPSTGFFSLFGTLDERVPVRAGDPIFSVFPGWDVNAMMSPGRDAERPLVMLCYNENVKGEKVRTMTAFELALFDDVRQWADTRAGCRGNLYGAYKKERVRVILDRLTAYIPELEFGCNCVDSASMLTFRDYLNSPYGSAYGIKQKVGQFNLAGKLPLRNLYAAGQSAILPGVMGAMASSFFVARAMLGKTKFQQYIDGRLCH